MKILKILLVVIMLIGCQTQEPKEPEISSLSFVAVGDNIMHEQMIKNAKQENTYDFSPYYQNIKSYIQDADLSFINQETILGGHSFGYSGYPLFNTPDEIATTLHDIGFDVVNGATNHAFDMGEKGVDHAISIFKKYQDMKYIGLYESPDDQNQISVITKNDIRIAFLAFNQYVNYDMKPDSYRYHSFDKEKMKNEVDKAKKVSDIIIASCHWGKEYEQEANDFQKEYAQYLADLGVDVIIGTHTHTLQDIEWLEDQNHHQTLVAYSLGNFISGMLEGECQLGGMLSMDFVKEDDTVHIENVTLTPLVNHYYVSNQKNIMETRYGFTVYRLKDYNDTLAKEHGLNGYNNQHIDISKMKKKVQKTISSKINIDM